MARKDVIGEVQGQVACSILRLVILYGFLIRPEVFLNIRCYLKD